MTKKEFIKAVAEVTNKTQKDTEVLIDAVFAVISNALKAGDEVGIQNFGKFKTIAKEARAARNPMTGGTVDVPAHNVVKFSVASALKELVR